ncbi:hypothetical protein AC625_17310 [Peribacillus loiseleuriae]|uniref:Uncharacterized protein n=1 Tax=Peribacillus loiseleuriae TaxID=1679170 RepID=A0A0K9GWQ0_9BACI|nr:hypothetical protein AC625_17310 [Peribacillus loiseleuriae]
MNRERDLDVFCRECSSGGEALFIKCGFGAQIGNLARKVKELARLSLLLARKACKGRVMSVFYRSVTGWKRNKFETPRPLLYTYRIEG